MSLAHIEKSKWRSDFPLLAQKRNGKPIIYLDTGASALKPWPVIEKIGHFLTYQSANVHRGAHFLSNSATDEFEKTRSLVAKFINSSSENEIIFTRGTTESLNIISHSLLELGLKGGQEILISELEHHSNIVPWQMAAQKHGAILKVVPVKDSGEIDLEAYAQLLNENTFLVSIAQCSNVLGTINPIQKMAKAAHGKGALFVVDGAQGISIGAVDVQSMGADFYCFSAHKLFGPYGTGVLYGRKELLEKLMPHNYGGSMISEVSFVKTTFNDLPHRLEGGTPNIEGVIGLGAAVEYVQKQNWNEIEALEHSLRHLLETGIKEIDGARIIGEAQVKGPLISFAIKGCHPSDLAQMLSEDNIAIRAGHLCAQPLLARFKEPAFGRASLSIYNQKSDVDKFLESLKKAVKLIRG